MNQPQGRGFNGGRGYGGGIGGPYLCFKCGVEDHRAFECPNYNMKETKQRQEPSLNLVQVKNEEGVESEFPPDMGKNLMIQRPMVIPEKREKAE